MVRTSKVRCDIGSVINKSLIAQREYANYGDRSARRCCDPFLLS